MANLVSDPASVRANCYDLAMNGLELGSGSIRIHRKDVQQQIFASLGISDEEARARFGFFLDALEYGTPPHGGIALGLDRIVMLLAGAANLREVIAFPKTAKAIDLMAEAPTHGERAAVEGTAHSRGAAQLNRRRFILELKFLLIVFSLRLSQERAARTGLSCRHNLGTAPRLWYIFQGAEGIFCSPQAAQGRLWRGSKTPDA